MLRSRFALSFALTLSACGLEPPVVDVDMDDEDGGGVDTDVDPEDPTDPSEGETEGDDADPSGSTGIPDDDGDTDDGDDDADGDGVGADEDCDDEDPAVHPGADELCDGFDNNCDGIVDEDAIDAPTAYPDADGDGWGSDAGELTACDIPEGYVEHGGDCDDDDDRFHPRAEESDCTDPNDYNCDGMTGYVDADADGFAACEDCDDGDGDVNPGADEYCDGIDTNCNGVADDDTAVDAPVWYADQDGDSYGDPGNTLTACDAQAGYVTDASDCDDGDETIHPGGTEHCDDVDENCNGIIDDDPVDGGTYYADADGDGWGDPTTAVTCTAPEGYVAAGDDCDDGNNAVNPGAAEACNEVDDDCDGAIDDDLAVQNQGAWVGGVLYATLDQALAAVPSGGTMAICPGTYEVTLSIWDDVTLRSTSGDPSNTILDGGGTHRILDVDASTLVLEGLTLRNGFDASSGGAIRAGDSAIVITNCEVRDNVAGYEGGAISMGGWDPVSVVVTDSLFRDNYADYGGGAIQISSWETTDLSVSGSTFFGNVAGYEAGAIGIGSWGQNTAFISESIFEANSSDGGGGAILLGGWEDGTMTVTGAQFLGNGANGNGGAILLEMATDGIFAATETSFIGNVANRGPAVYASSWADSNDVDLFSCTIESNVAASLFSGAVETGATAVFDSDDECDWASGATNNTPADLVTSCGTTIDVVGAESCP